MADVTQIEPGRWGFSRIISDGGGGWTTHAMQEQLASGISAKYPPLVNGAYPVPYAMVRLTGSLVAPVTNDTVLIPRNLDLAELTLGDLTAAQRLNLRNFLETWIDYQFTDWDGTLRSVAGLFGVVSNYAAGTLVRDVLRDLYRYLGHTASRVRPDLAEWHNTEYTDNFDSDTSGNWTPYTGSTGMIYDGTNGEMNFEGDNDVGVYYSANNSGSMEHEAQLTGTYAARIVGPGVRMQSGAGNFNGYGVSLDQFANYQLWKYVAGTRTGLETVTIGSRGASDWVTQRLAASGGNGANVVLSYWVSNHGTTKPSNPGWIGVDGSPNETYTDTAADRHDDSAANLECGVMSRGNVGGDSNSDFFKLRAISDRGGAAAGAFPFQARHPMAHLLVR